MPNQARLHGRGAACHRDEWSALQPCLEALTYAVRALLVSAGKIVEDEKGPALEADRALGRRHSESLCVVVEGVTDVWRRLCKTNRRTEIAGCTPALKSYTEDRELVCVSRLNVKRNREKRKCELYPGRDVLVA